MSSRRHQIRQVAMKCNNCLIEPDANTSRLLLHASDPFMVTREAKELFVSTDNLAGCVNGIDKIFVELRCNGAGRTDACQLIDLYHALDINQLAVGKICQLIPCLTEGFDDPNTFFLCCLDENARGQPLESNLLRTDHLQGSATSSMTNKLLVVVPDNA